MAKRLSEIELEMLLESMVEGVVFIDNNDRFVYFNRSAEKMVRFDTGKLIGKSIFSIHSKAIEPKVTKAIKDLRTGRKKLFQTEIKFKDRFFEVRVSPVKDVNRKYLGLLATTNDITNRVLLEEQIKSLAIQDGLTGLYNLRHFYCQLEKEIRRSVRYNRPLSLLFLDLDNFKDYNDKFGHIEGDKVLKSLAEISANSVRDKIDSVYRYGGDEFTVILPETDERQAVVVSKRILEKFKRLNLDNLGLSIGIAQYQKHLDIPNFVKQADDAMYSAKKAGGNVYHVYKG
jgi:diguanylate cyclase (GGDEF)-like protein/PAS domain S-box-containing protein